jgi:tripartite ATP-independent transporter DctM subunit
MIVWGILTEQSIGQLFAAGIFPGLLLAFLFIVYIFGFALLRPAAVGIGSGIEETARKSGSDDEEVSTLQFLVSLMGISLVIVAVLGGIWFGIFTPTEGAGAGALIGLALGIIKGMRFREIINSILSVGRTSAPILLLLVTAALYSRTLAMTGLANAIEGVFLGSSMAPWMIVGVMVLIWFALGMIIDSISIMLLTAAIFAPIAVQIGYDPIAFAIIAIIAIEAGLLTPPFGLLVYTVKAAISSEGEDVPILEIFKSSTPYWIIMLVGMVLIINFPEIATYLPRLLF